MAAFTDNARYCFIVPLLSSLRTHQHPGFLDMLVPCCLSPPGDGQPHGDRKVGLFSFIRPKAGCLPFGRFLICVC